jgi:hypothetical protein
LTVLSCHMMSHLFPAPDCLTRDRFDDQLHWVPRFATYVFLQVPRRTPAECR